MKSCKMVALKKLKPSAIASGMLSSFQRYATPRKPPITKKIQQQSQRLGMETFGGSSGLYQALGMQPLKMPSEKKKKYIQKYIVIKGKAYKKG